MKDEVLVLMSDAALERPQPLPDGIDWRTGLVFWSRGRSGDFIARMTG